MARQRKQRLAAASVESKALEAIIGKAVLDPRFRQLLFRSPEKVKEAYNLTAREAAALKRIQPDQLKAFADALKAKLLKSAAVTIFCGATRRE